MAKPPGKKLKADITLRVDRDLLEEMRIAASRQDRSLNGFMNAAIRRQLREIMPNEMKALERRGKKK